MCYYRLFVFVGCGHSTISSTPIRYCVNAPSYALDATTRRASSTDKAMAGEQQRCDDHSIQATCATAGLQPCAEGWTHPFHRVRLERRCAVCEYEREERLHALEASTDEIRFDPGRWRCKYQGHNGALATKKGDASRYNGAGKQGSGLWGIGTAVEGWLA